MGSAKRMRPKLLGEKLRLIRNHLDCSLAQMAYRLSNDEFSVRRTAVSQYELNDREPPLPVLLRYAEIANVYLEVIVDDRIDLPESIPSRKKSEGSKRQK
jgi:transcriptional regulator with XRE-family HTH domain